MNVFLEQIVPAKLKNRLSIGLLNITQFYHDVFHGYGHVCDPRYDGRLQRHQSPINTSLMEQVHRSMFIM